ncbi:hypothetical protein BDF22DRAFT_739336 [Syncephalis plumigaleata]|nr:hypothetical protein BDF22DRAFT_739336 [Syncephalis plumigaleata]
MTSVAAFSISGGHEPETKKSKDLANDKITTWSDMEEIQMDDVLDTQLTAQQKCQMVETNKAYAYTVDWPSEHTSSSNTISISDGDQEAISYGMSTVVGRWCQGSASSASSSVGNPYWPKHINQPGWLLAHSADVYAKRHAYNVHWSHGNKKSHLVDKDDAGEQEGNSRHLATQTPLKMFIVPSHHDADQRWRGGQGRPRRHYTIHFRPGKRPRRRVRVQRSVTWTKQDLLQMQKPVTRDTTNSGVNEAKQPETTTEQRPSPTLPYIRAMSPVKVRHYRNSAELIAPVARWSSRNAITRWNHELDKQQCPSIRMNTTSNDNVDDLELQECQDGLPAINTITNANSNTNSNSSIGGSHPITPISLTGTKYEDGLINGLELAAERARIHRDLMRAHRFNNTGSCTSSRTDFTGLYSLPVSLRESQLNELLPGPVTHVRRTRTWHSSSAHIGIWLFLAGFLFPPFWMVGSVYLPWPRTERTHADYEWQHRSRVSLVLTIGTITLCIIALGFIKM